jgi:hypothetical protein
MARLQDAGPVRAALDVLPAGVRKELIRELDSGCRVGTPLPLTSFASLSLSLSLPIVMRADSGGRRAIFPYYAPSLLRNSWQRGCLKAGIALLTFALSRARSVAPEVASPQVFLLQLREAAYRAADGSASDALNPERWEVLVLSENEAVLKARPVPE